MAKPDGLWHYPEINPEDLPDTGVRVIIDIGHMFVGEGYRKTDGKWYRYDELDPVEKFMRMPVVAWRDMPGPSPKPKKAK